MHRAYRFGDGQVVAAGLVSFKPGARTPIVGGTGAYSLARGDVEAGAPVKGYDSVHVLHLAACSPGPPRRPTEAESR